jgi:Family of unknown function (DUF6461)
MAADEIGVFEWIQSTVLRDGACVTLVAPADAGGVVRGFGGDLAGARRTSLAEIGMPPVDEPVVAVRDLGSWLLVAEVNGWQGSRPEVLRRISAGGRAVSAYWNVNLTTRFSYAAGGRVLTAFEVMSPDRRHGADPDCLEEARAGLPWEDGEWVPLMLALASRVTGLRIEPQWFNGGFAVMPVIPVDDDPASMIYPPTEALTYDDGPLAWALLHAGDVPRRSVAGIAAGYAADQAARHGARTARGRNGGAPEAAMPEDRVRAGRFWAKTAAREASGPDPLAAAFKSATAAYLCLQSLGSPEDGLRAEVMSALGNPAPPAGSLGLTTTTGPAPTDRYLWTSAHWLAPVGAVRFVRGTDMDEIAEALGADTASARNGIPALSREGVTAFRQMGDWLVAVEGPRPVSAICQSQPMPVGTTTVSVSWEARSRSWVHYMTGDTLVAGLDPQRPGQQMRLGTDPGFLNEYTAGLQLPFPPAGYAAAQLPVMLVIAERLTGLAFAPEWLDEPHVLMSIRT